MSCVSVSRKKKSPWPFYILLQHALSLTHASIIMVISFLPMPPYFKIITQQCNKRSSGLSHVQATEKMLHLEPSNNFDRRVDQHVSYLKFPNDAFVGEKTATGCI